uniref:Uncharacterized protein n=1 Tax=Anopheles albimanus TaxID=7167 RepID=A0A182FM17_ANOAL
MFIEPHSKQRPVRLNVRASRPHRRTSRRKTHLAKGASPPRPRREFILGPGVAALQWTFLWAGSMIALDTVRSSDTLRLVPSLAIDQGRRHHKVPAGRSDWKPVFQPFCHVWYAFKQREPAVGA